jgi:hypothetical protein
LISQVLSTPISEPIIKNLALETPSNTVAIGLNASVIGASDFNNIIYDGSISQYSIQTNTNGSISTVDTIAARNGVNALSNIQRLSFSDASLAFDITGGNAGFAAKVLGAVFGADSLSNKNSVGVVLGYVDTGMSSSNLMLIALNAKLGLGFTTTQEIQLLYNNVFGVEASQAVIDKYNSAIVSGQYTQASLAVAIAESSANKANINITGIEKSGLQYNAYQVITSPGATVNINYNASVIGNLGINSASYDGSISQYSIAKNNDGVISTTDSIAKRDGSNTLTNIQRLNFSDASLAFDIVGGNTGTAAEILGSVFGAKSLSNATSVGVVQGYVDTGLSLPGLMLIALNARLGVGFTNTQEIKLLYQNIYGTEATQTEIDTYNSLIDTGQYSQASFAAAVAEGTINKANINLIGLAENGLKYIPHSISS